MPDLAGLIVLSAAVYGWAWVLTKSKLLRPLRARLSSFSVANDLISCIVCTGFWIALALLAFCGTPVRDYPVSLGFSLAFSWTLARLLGDAS